MYLYCHRFGHGPRTLLAFHGIGQDGASGYASFAECLGDYYTLYAFDLPFHGQSGGMGPEGTFSNRNVLNKVLWQKYLQDFLRQHHIQRFDVVGFSLGGRLALATLEAFPHLIDRAYLIAPDGVREHVLYSLATRFAPTRLLFRAIIKYPSPLLGTAEVLQKAGVLPGSLLRFTRHMLATPERRLLIYRSWLTFRGLRFAIPSLIQRLRPHGVALFLFTGQYDRMLRTQDLAVLARQLPEAQSVTLPSGHTHLVEKVAEYLAGTLK
ncbi:hypothetical protein GCM10027275_27980 [Rhabdobacter roseus]|uniref:Pimeloyl-ACP methyl ester carboxylesterase n=1 Tax=Rhabdobacter roseus TaxID=1655419 RepID=A0A840TKN3_9BACT|nr:alpha/beta hydrolase [Rhabdobacter roseus]MBB5284746.1 pimeloyl-ACP methyl ester carboxylesterase [Rhabdobacter roseus]